MSTLDTDTIKVIQDRYLSEKLDTVDEPSLKEYAEEYNVPIKLLRQVATNNNWLGLRRRKAEKLKRELVKAEEMALAKEAIDIVAIQTKILKDSLTIIDEDIPLVREHLMALLPAMGAKEAVQLYKLLLDLRGNVSTTLLKAGKEVNKHESTEDLNPLLRDLGAQISTLANGGKLEVTDERSDSTNVFTSLDEYQASADDFKSDDDE